MVDFPYHINTLGDYFPIIKINTYHKNYLAKTSALIDSGATISIFRTEIAEELHIVIEKGKEIFLVLEDIVNMYYM